MRLRGVVVLCVAFALDAACARVQCQYNSECGSRARCVENRCVTDCFADRDCPSDSPRCTENGECVAGELPDASAPADGTAPPVDASTPLDAPAPTDLGALDVPAPQDLGTPTDVVSLPDVVTPRDAVSLPDVVTANDVVTPRDAVSLPDVVALPDVVNPRDVPAVDAGSVVAPGFYDYAAVRPDTLIYPAAAAWHPSGTYALVLAHTDRVHRFDAATRTLTQVAATSPSVAWRHVSFTPNGARAILLGNNGAGTSRRGFVYVWESGTASLSERTADALSGGGYESVAWSPDGTRGVLLATRQPSGSANVAGWWLDADGARGNYAFAYGLVASTGCEDVDFSTDGFGDPALSVVCGINTGMILTVNNLDTSPRVSVAQSSGSVGNVSRIATHPRGVVSLAIGSSSNRLYRLRQGLWTVGFDTPTLAGAYDVAFNDLGTRALAFGGNGRVWEYRTDLFDRAEIRDVSIAGLSGPPYNQPSNANLRAVAWRPGCDEGLAMGGSSTLSGTSAFITYFRVTNGRACAN